MRGHKVWIGILGIIVGLVFTASCSKNLIPPEIEATGTIGDSELEEIAESNEGTPGFAPEQDFPIDESGSEESGFVRQESLALPLGQTKVHHVRLTVSIDHDVTRFNITMDYASLVGVMKRLGDFGA